MNLRHYKVNLYLLSSSRAINVGTRRTCTWMDVYVYFKNKRQKRAFSLIWCESTISLKCRSFLLFRQPAWNATETGAVSECTFHLYYDKPRLLVSLQHSDWIVRRLYSELVQPCYLHVLSESKRVTDLKNISWDGLHCAISALLLITTCQTVQDDPSLIFSECL